ncbi:MAG TPA: hypothetical protein VGM51_04720 [Armatimonadota bacterium]
MNRLISLLAVAVLAAGLSPGAHAFPKEAAKKPVLRKNMRPGMNPGMMPGKKAPGRQMMGRAVYVCRKCEQAWTPAQARKMGYKDPMGHRLFRVAKLPPGMKMGRMMSGDKMPMMGNMPMKGQKPPMKGRKGRMKGDMPMNGRMPPKPR